PEDLVADLGEAEQSWAQLVNETTPEDMLEQAQKLAAAYDLAHKLLDTLRPEDRVITTLKESEELTIEEIAKIMGWSGAKVKIRIFRARQLMRRRAEQILSMGRGARKR
ncbi:MAG: sigma factor-like helix-turn-helix DNA-binding protein, partial [Candidatus Binataceae bacterium]